MAPKKAATTAAAAAKKTATKKTTATKKAAVGKQPTGVKMAAATNKDQNTLDLASRKVAAKATTKLPTAPKRAATKKRKASDAVNTTEDEAPKANTHKRRKSNDDVAAPKPPPPVKRAAQKPKTIKPKNVINYAPTQRLDIYVSGEGSQGELGLGSGKASMNALKPRLNPKLSAAEVGVVQLATGGMHCAALTHDNQILTWGVNDEGALGRDTEWDGGLVDIDDKDSDASSEIGDLNPKEATPTAVEFESFPEGTVFTQVTAGDSCTFALTDEGQVYGWGTFRGNDGILGFSRTQMIQKRPVLIPELKKVTKLAAGAHHVLALCSNGAVFAWGAGQQHQLGRRIVQRTKLNGLVPREFGLPKGMTDLAAGDTHSFAVHKNGKVYTWGLNNYGQTGIAEGAGGNEAVVLHPTVVDSLQGQGKIVSIDGGQLHSIAVTEDGKCLSWGRVDGFQTGLKLDSLPEDDIIRDDRGNPKILTKPTRVPGIENSVCATAGTDYSIAVTRDGKAYSWGFCDGYRTGQGTDDDIEVARVMNGKQITGKKIIWAGAGGQFSVLAGEPPVKPADDPTGDAAGEPAPVTNGVAT